MINSVKVIGKGRYIVNNSLIVYDIVFSENTISYNIKFDDMEIQEKEAEMLANEFINETLDGIVKNNITPTP